MRISLITGAFLATLGACGPLTAAQNPAHSAAHPAATPAPFPMPVRAVISGAEGKAIGMITLRQGAGGVLIDLEFQAGVLTPGWHGMHFHQIGTCADAGFKASGAHVGHVEGVQHGLLNPVGPEAGDLPNLFVPEGGVFRAQAFSALTQLYPLPGAQAALLDADGAAFVIHAAADDHTSQPIGGAGARVACAELVGGARR
jgi:superoxide dismutase, Cu-Zn family